MMRVHRTIKEKSIGGDTTKRVFGPRKESLDHEKSLRTTRGACKPMRWHVSDESPRDYKSEESARP